MAVPFAVGDLRDLLRLLEDHPEWKAEVRRAVLTEELLELPRVVRDLAEAQKRTEERLEALAASVEALTARVDALTARVDALTARVDALAASVEALTARVDALTARVDALVEQMAALAERQMRLEDTVGRLVGSDLERTFRERVSAVVRRPFRGVRLVAFEEVRDMLDRAADAGRLSADDADEVLHADAFVRARDADGDLLLVVEVSRVVDRHDVERAVRRAEILGSLGGRVMAGVAGERLTRGAAEATARGVAVSWLMPE